MPGSSGPLEYAVILKWLTLRTQEKGDADLESALRRAPSGGLGARGPSSARKLASRLPTAAGHGQISARVWLVVAYLVVLHLTVMVGFTRRNDLDALCQDYSGGRTLPGT